MSGPPVAVPPLLSVGRLAKARCLSPRASHGSNTNRMDPSLIIDLVLFCCSLAPRSTWNPVVLR